ncbi:MAG: NADH-quinone oxidoreductase subunit I [Deltaproteobacteria bacterium]|nr:NADH-quinone oxidoreductase subunit I [Deltaproteobacteria bacterium]
MTVREYVDNIKDAVTSFWAGMAVTGSHLFRRPMTVQYPDRVDVPVKDTLPPRYRGFLEADLAVCTGCQACERACPIGCIAIAVEKSPADPKQRLITRFDIDVAKCMYCGLCVEPCPTGALQHTREFESAMTHVENLTLRFADPLKPVPVFKVTKGEAYPRRMVGEILKEQAMPWDAPAPAPVDSSAGSAGGKNP